MGLLISPKASRSFRCKTGARILNHALSSYPYHADMEKNPALQGFTLLEIAIVLSIIGLLIGGVLAGSNLVRAAQIRRIATEEQRIVTAVRVFKSIYPYNDTCLDMLIFPAYAVSKDSDHLYEEAADVTGMPNARRNVLHPTL